MVHYVFNYYAFSDHYILGNIWGIGDTRKKINRILVLMELTTLMGERINR